MAACGVIIWLLLAVPTFIYAQPDGSLRLVDGGTENVGRVEVYYSGTWGTVCDDSWHLQDADVVCRQLGFESAKRVVYRAGFGVGTGPIWIDQISCRGNEASILECRHNGWGIHDCVHREDAGVECKRKEAVKPASLPLRLSCPTYNEDGSCKVCPAKQHPDSDDCYPQVSVEGIVEVFYNDRWRPVSADGWDINNAKVACGELGYPTALGVPKLEVLWPNWDGTHAVSACEVGSTAEQCDPFVNMENKAFRERLKSTFLKKVDCSGKERGLIDCYIPEFGPHDNPSLSVATVQCGYLPHQSCYSDSVEAYRTRSGPVPWIGRAEVRVEGVWGTICDTAWDLNSASVFCRTLGYGTAKTATYRGTHGRGVGPIHYSELRCTGSELYLSSCTHKTGPAAQACGHRGDAGVICNAPQKCEPPNAARLIEVPDSNNFINHYVEVKGSQGWGLLCYGNLELKAAEVVCRENKNQFAIRVRSGTLSDYSGRYYNGQLECNGEEMTANECKMMIGSVTSCNSGHTMIDCTTGLPDLVPDLEAFRRSLRYYPYVDSSPMYYLKCASEEGCLSSSAVGKPSNHQRHLLRFDSQTMNWGTIDFLPNLQPHEWEWHSCHGHYHSFEAFIHYDILDITTGEKKAEGHKASFCLEDSFCSTGGSATYRCGGRTATQGISANCGDVYGRHLDCQWVDITDISPGTYILRLQVNPSRLAPESDYRNNEIQCTVQYYQGFYLYAHSCKHSDH